MRPESDRLRLVASDRLEVDVWLFQQRLDQAERADSPRAALDAYMAALPLWRGPCLADVQDAGWALGPREQLERRFVAAAVRAGELCLARDGAAEALALAARALEIDRYCEPAFRLQAAAHRARGDRAAMRRALERCRQALRELGTVPEPETRMLGRAATGALA